MVQIHLLRISLNFGISISSNKSGIKINQKRKNMCRCCKFLVCFIICFVSHIYANANDKRDYTYLFLYYMELSEEVKSTIEDFLQNNTHTKKNFYYLEISILYHETDTTRVHYRLKWINSPDRDKLVINEEILYNETESLYDFVGFSYYKNLCVVIKKWYKLQNIKNPFIKLTPDLFVNRFLLWKHKIYPSPVHIKYGSCFTVRTNEIIKCPPPY